MSSPRCETCKYWVVSPKMLETYSVEFALGECQRYPAYLAKCGHQSCGEHSPRKTLPVVEQPSAKLKFHVSGDNVWRADAGTHRFRIAKEGEEHYTAMMYGYDPVAWGSYETAVAWCESMLTKYRS